MPRPETGAYMVIEGMDGSGKTTQRDLLAEYLVENGLKVEVISEPGGTPVGDEIRRILKDGKLERTASSNLDLFMIARRELIAQRVKPLNSAGVTVISDRNWYSSMAYQGFGEAMDHGYIERKARETLVKDRYVHPPSVIIEVPVDIAIERMLKRGESANDYFEQKGRSFFEKIAEGYRWVADFYRVPVIDGDRAIEHVHEEVVKNLGNLAILS